MLEKVHSEGAPDRFSKVNEGKFIQKHSCPDWIRFLWTIDGDSRVRKNRDMFNSNWNKIAKYICEAQHFPDALREN